MIVRFKYSLSIMPDLEKVQAHVASILIPGSRSISDYLNALTYVESRDDVDPLRPGCHGISYSGGHVLILAAIDPRIKSVVSIVPVVDGFSNLRRAHGERCFADFQAATLRDRRDLWLARKAR